MEKVKMPTAAIAPTPTTPTTMSFVRPEISFL